MKVQKKVRWSESKHRGGFQPGDRVRVSKQVLLIGRRRAIVVSSHRRLPWGRVAIKLKQPGVYPSGSPIAAVWDVDASMLTRIP